MSTETYMTTIPDCQLDHTTPTPAAVDGKMRNGPWAYMCQYHYDQFGVGLGTGKGQRLIQGTEPVMTKDEKRAQITAAIDGGADFDEIEELVGDGDLAEYL